MNQIMIKKILLAIITLVASESIAQVNLHTLKANDTCCSRYYKDGQLKYFELNNQYLTHRDGMYMEVYLDSVCDIDKQEQSIKKNVVEDNNWRRSIFHYKDSISIYFLDRFKLPIYKNKNCFGIILHNYGNLGLYVEYNNDLLVNRFSVQKVVEGKYNNEIYYSDLYFNLTSLEKSFSFTTVNNNYLYLDFSTKFFLKELRYFYNHNGNDMVLWVNFFDKNKPKEYGNIDSVKGRTGKWYSYYENGKLKSEGEYSGSKFKRDEEFDIKKTGKWIYYTNEGCIDYQEIWEDGILKNL